MNNWLAERVGKSSLLAVATARCTLFSCVVCYHSIQCGHPFDALLPTPKSWIRFVVCSLSNQECSRIRKNCALVGLWNHNSGPCFTIKPSFFGQYTFTRNNTTGPMANTSHHKRCCVAMLPCLAYHVCHHSHQFMNISGFGSLSASTMTPNQCLCFILLKIYNSVLAYNCFEWCLWALMSCTTDW